MLIQLTSSIFLPRGYDLRPCDVVFKPQGVDYGGGGVMGRFDDSVLERIFGGDAELLSAARAKVSMALAKGGAHVVGSAERVERKADKSLPALPGSDRPIEQKRKKVKESTVIDSFHDTLT